MSETNENVFRFPCGCEGDRTQIGYPALHRCETGEALADARKRSWQAHQDACEAYWKHYDPTPPPDADEAQR